MEFAISQFNRTKGLFDTKVATKQEFDEVVNRKQVAQAQLVVKQKKYDLLKDGSRSEDIADAKAKLEEAKFALQLKQNGYRKEDIAVAKASVSAAQEALNAIDRQIKELVIRAPCSGVVEAIELQPGDLVGPNAPAISIIDTKKLWIRAYVPEKILKS